ncbi:MAG: ROK family protein [Frankiaceae bacterium]
MVSPTPGSQSSLREANEQRVLRSLLAHGAQTQADIARRTGLSPATVSNIVRDLRTAGAVEVTPVAGRRRAVRVSLARSTGVVVGIDFGHRHLRVAVADLSHTVLAETSEQLDVDHSATEGLRIAVALIDRLLAEAGADRDEVVGVGMGVPGPIDTTTGAVGSSSILPGWVGLDPAATLREALDRPVHVDNDANLGALGEAAWGAGRGHGDVAYIKAATGVGAGLLLGGRLYRGRAGTAGEIGHTTIDENGDVCRCGNRGCLETYVGTPMLLSLLRRSHGQELTLRDVLRLATDGDVGCRRVIADAGRYIGVAVANLCNLLSPELVIVGGDLAAAGDLLLQPLRDAVRRYAIPSAAHAMRVVPGELGERAEVLGALALALRRSEAHLVDDALGAITVG